MKDLKILNGKIPNFESNTWEIGDILIDKGVIQKVGTVYDDTAETIDAQQKINLPAARTTFSPPPVKPEWA